MEHTPPKNYTITLNSAENEKTIVVQKEHLEQIPVFEEMLKDLPAHNNHINIENAVSETELLTLVHYLEQTSSYNKHINELHDDAHVLHKFELTEPLNTVVNYIARRIAKKKRLPTHGLHCYATFQDNSRINILIAGALHNNHLPAFKDHITQQSPLTQLTHVSDLIFTSLATTSDASQILCTTYAPHKPPCILFKNKQFTYGGNIQSNSVAVLQDNKFTFARGNKIYVYNEQELPQLLYAIDDAVFIDKIITTPNKETIIAKGNNVGSFNIYDVNAKKECTIFSNEAVNNITASNTVIATCNLNTITLRNTASGFLQKKIIWKNIHALVLNDNNKLVIAGAEGLINTLDIQSGRTISSFGKEQGPFTRLLLTPDDKKLIALASNNTVHVFDSQAGKLICTMPNIEQRIKDFAWADNAHELILMSDNRIHAWDLSAIKKIATASLPDLVKNMKNTENS
jgi:WD40 repeat protein